VGSSLGFLAHRSLALKSATMHGEDDHRPTANGQDGSVSRQPPPRFFRPCAVRSSGVGRAGIQQFSSELDAGDAGRGDDGCLVGELSRLGAERGACGRLVAEAGDSIGHKRVCESARLGGEARIIRRGICALLACGGFSGGAAGSSALRSRASLRDSVWPVINIAASSMFRLVAPLIHSIFVFRVGPFGLIIVD